MAVTSRGAPAVTGTGPGVGPGGAGVNVVKA